MRVRSCVCIGALEWSVDQWAGRLREAVDNSDVRSSALEAEDAA